MIDYELLVHAIAQWKAGQRPSAPPIPARAPRAEHGDAGVPSGDMEEIESGLVEVEDASGQVEMEAEAWDGDEVAVEDAVEDEVQVEE